MFALVDRAGVGGATVRGVAAEAGWSMGAVRYYFSTQDDLLLFAVEEMARRVEDRVRAILTREQPSAQRAERLLSTMLPRDAERAAEVRVWAAFMVIARLDEAYERVRASTWSGERFIARIAVADVAGRGWPDTLDGPLADPSLEPDAERLHALLDGLSIQGITYADADPASLRRMLASALAEVAERARG